MLGHLGRDQAGKEIDGQAGEECEDERGPVMNAGTAGERQEREDANASLVLSLEQCGFCGQDNPATQAAEAM